MDNRHWSWFMDHCRTKNLHTYYQMHGWARLLLGPWHLVLDSMALTEVLCLRMVPTCWEWGMTEG